MPDDVVEDYSITLEDKMINFYHNTKTHQFDIFVDGELITFTKARGQAIIDFLKFISIPQAMLYPLA